MMHLWKLDLNYACVVTVVGHLLSLWTIVNTVNFLGINFFFVLGSTKTYSGVVKITLSRCSLVIFFVRHKINQHHTMIHLQASGQHKNKADLTHVQVYYTHASTNVWSKHKSYAFKVSKQNICCKYCCGYFNLH